MIEFAVSPPLEELRARVMEFVRAEVMPAEARETAGHGPDDGLRSELQHAAKARGLFAPQVPIEMGGLGLDFRDQAIVLEAAGYSLLGPLALNCAAPDDGNSPEATARSHSTTAEWAMTRCSARSDTDSGTRR
jgi:acyl-CoA dehydrogenase